MARRSPACRCNSTWATGRRHQRPDRHPCGARSGVCRDVRLFGASWRLSGRKLDEPKGLARDELSLKLADVAYWRYSDLPRCLLFDRFRKQSGHQGALRVTRLFHIPRNGLGSALSGAVPLPRQSSCRLGPTANNVGPYFLRYDLWATGASYAALDLHSPIGLMVRQSTSTRITAVSPENNHAPAHMSCCRDLNPRYDCSRHSR